MKAVILAGGKGRRLLPYTTNFPKPLMPIGERPILEIVIEQLRQHGFSDIIIATGHMEGLIRAFFQGGDAHGVAISYSKEDQSLGTAGPLNLVRDRLDDTFLMMNGDVLTDLDYSQMLKYHKERKATATIGLCKRTVDIDFGVITLDMENCFATWQEKPQIGYLVSTGIYVFEPEAVEVMPREGFFNVPDLIQALKSEGKRVSAYVHDGYWLDIGRREDYERACKDYKEKFQCPRG
jgi:NDP-sugar pyrophosphorylase family protein